MQGIFIGKILDMSLIGCYSILIVLAVRLILIRSERKYAYYLWLIVFFNLLIPLSIPGIFSLIPKQVAGFSVQEELALALFSEGGSTLPGGSAGGQSFPFGSSNADSGTNMQNMPIAENSPTGEDLPMGGLPAGNIDIGDTKPSPTDGMIAPELGDKVRQPDLEGLGSTVTDSENVQVSVKEKISSLQLKNFLAIVEEVWLMGILLIALLNLLRIRKFRKQLENVSEFDEKRGIAVIEGLSAPFLYGLIHPIIYLPAGLAKEEKRYIIAHERCHKRRKDYILKIVVYMITALHWFNPLVWLAYGLFCRDMEISCDEEVLSRNSENIKKSYAESLLKYAARQNGYVMAPLTFGEPSVKVRIRNVLRFKKKGVAVSVMALLCMAGVAIGLAFRPVTTNADQGAGGDPSGFSEGEDQNPQDPIAGVNTVIENNGGTVIRLNGELYYGNQTGPIKKGLLVYAGNVGHLYTDGTFLYTNSDSDGALLAGVKAYYPDGSGLQTLFAGRIVDCKEDGTVLYYINFTEDYRRNLYAYDTASKESVLLFSDISDYLGRFEERLYVSYKQEGLLYLGAIAEEDGSVSYDLLKQGLSVSQITCFYADEDYYLFSAGEYQGTGNYFYGDFYSYDRKDGSLKEEHLADTDTFHVADGRVYYETQSYTSDQSSLLSTDFAFENQKVIGERLRFLAYEKTMGTILAERTVEGASEDYRYYRDLVRVTTDGEVTDLLSLAHWQLERYESIVFSEPEFLGDEIYFWAEHLGYSNTEGDIVLRRQYFCIDKNGETTECNPRAARFMQEEMRSTPYDLSEGSWNLENAVTINRVMSEIHLPEDTVYLLASTENFMLYSRGDGSSMLLSDGESYAEIACPAFTPYKVFLPEIAEFDCDYDKEAELVILLHTKSGTGYSVDTLLIADRNEEGELCAYELLEQDYLTQLWEHLSYGQTQDGLQAYVDGMRIGRPMADKTRMEIGDLVHIRLDQNRIILSADFTFRGDGDAIFDTNERAIYAVIDYYDGGSFLLRDFAGKDSDETGFTLTEKGKAFLEEMCRVMPDNWSGTEDNYYDEIVSDFGTEQYSYLDHEVQIERYYSSVKVTYAILSEDGDRIGIVEFWLYPADNENNFVIREKDTTYN